jgi:hypothetical protein
VGKRGLLDQIHKLQKEVKDLQYELLTVNERREIQERKYEDRKMKTKVKLMRARYDVRNVSLVWCVHLNNQKCAIAKDVD